MISQIDLFTLISTSAKTRTSDTTVTPLQYWTLSNGTAALFSLSGRYCAMFEKSLPWLFLSRNTACSMHRKIALCKMIFKWCTVVCIFLYHLAKMGRLLYIYKSLDHVPLFFLSRTAFRYVTIRIFTHCAHWNEYTSRQCTVNDFLAGLTNFSHSTE